MVAPSVYLKDWSMLESYTLIDRHDRAHDFRLLRHRRIRRAFEKFRSPLKRAKALSDGCSNGIDWTIFEADRAIEVAIKAINRNPTATLSQP
jgi:hypothetical protein